MIENSFSHIFHSISDIVILWTNSWVDEFVITNKRVVIKTGLISRRTLELNLSKIESVGVNQSIMGRLLGYGCINLVGTGGTNESFYQIDDPISFRKKFQEYC